MGAAWKVRAHLQNTNGAATGSLIANNLFLGWMNGYNQSEIKSIILSQWLTLDDNDGNISNGTPHFTQIDAAFRTQGFPGVDISCPAPATFCSSGPNSANPSGASITFIGSTNVSINDFTIMAAGLPPDNTGLFFYGQNQIASVPFGNGSRCIGNPFFRLAATTANFFGDIETTLDMNSLPSGGQITYGQTWNFQCWYRDPAAGGANYNSSNGLSVFFCP
jgi:hypothetical protein